MRAFQYHCGKITEGLTLFEDARLGDVVFLGEKGRGRRYEKVALHKKAPPEIHERGGVKIIESCHPVRFKTKGGDRTFYVLAGEKRPDNRVLVRINTQCTYTRGTEGRWKIVDGKSEELAKGWGAHGDAGRIGSWGDGLVLMHPGSVVKVTPEGGYKCSEYALMYPRSGAEPVAMPWEEYLAQEAATGEGEYL